MIYLYWAGGLLGLLAVASLWIPTTSSTTGTATFDAPIEEVWAVYTDFASQPDWRDEVVSVRFKEDSGETAWVETLSPGGIEVHLSVVESDPPNRLVLRTWSPGSFEGTYTAEFEATDEGATGTFTETSRALGYFPKLMRFLFVDQRKMIDKYAEDARAEIDRRRE